MNRPDNPFDGADKVRLLNMEKQLEFLRIAMKKMTKIFPILGNLLGLMKLSKEWSQKICMNMLSIN